MKRQWDSPARSLIIERLVVHVFINVQIVFIRAC